MEDSFIWMTASRNSSSSSRVKSLHDRRLLLWHLSGDSSLISSGDTPDSSRGSSRRCGTGGFMIFMTELWMGRHCPVDSVCLVFSKLSSSLPTWHEKIIILNVEFWKSAGGIGRSWRAKTTVRPSPDYLSDTPGFSDFARKEVVVYFVLFFLSFFSTLLIFHLTERVAFSSLS